MKPAPLRPEAIVDAALDDDVFAHLPHALASTLGARSAVIHWSIGSASVESELRHNHYFSDAQLALLDHRFDGHDLWANALRGRNAIGRVWNCDDLVSTRAYENGHLYNEWIRASGDDSFHAIGIAASGGGVSMEIGLHRGRSQGSFSSQAAAALSAMVRPLEQMLQLRARLASTRKEGRSAQAALDGHGDPVLLVRPGGCPVRINLAAETMLAGGDLLMLRQGRLHALRAEDDARLQRALASIDEAETGDTLAMLDRAGRQCLLTVNATMVDGQRHLIVLVRTQADEEKVKRVARLYGLSVAEAEVAVGVAAGHTPQEIAIDRQTSVHTVRTQLKVVLAKMGVRRQSEVATAIAMIPAIARARLAKA